MTTEPTSDDAALRQFCDRMITVGAETMAGTGASLGMILDRLLTFSVAHAVRSDGSEATAALLESVIEQLRQGKFAHLERQAGGTKH
jgi:hypothetical protein